MIPVINQIENPVLLDRAFNQMQTAFLSKLSWLNESFGKAYRIVKKEDNVEYAEPAVYVNKSEYLSVLPNDEVGNFSFFLLDDPQEFDGTVLNARGLLKAKVSIVFWFSLTTIIEDDSSIASETIKYDILKVLTSPGLLTNGRLTVLSINEKAENIYKSFSLKQVDNQFLMFPYYGFKFNCELLISELC